MTLPAVWSDRGGGGVSPSLRIVWYEACWKVPEELPVEEHQPDNTAQLLKMWKDDLMQLFQQLIQLI